MSEDLESMLSQSLPFLLLVSLEVHTDLLNVGKDLFDSSIAVTVLWFCVISEEMIDSIWLWTIFEEVPVVRRSYGVHETSLLVVNFGLLLKDFTVRDHQSLGVGNSQIVVILNRRFNFILFHSFEAFKENIVLDVLQDVIIDVFQGFSGVQPLLHVLLREIRVPDPKATIFFSFLLFLFGG